MFSKSVHGASAANTDRSRVHAAPEILMYDPIYCNSQGFSLTGSCVPRESIS